MKLFNLHTHHSTNQENILELVNQYPWEFDEKITFYSIGIHPWYINEDKLSIDLQTIEQKLTLNNCLFDQALHVRAFFMRIKNMLFITIPILRLTQYHSLNCSQYAEIG